MFMKKVRHKHCESFQDTAYTTLNRTTEQISNSSKKYNSNTKNTSTQRYQKYVYLHVRSKCRSNDCSLTFFQEVNMTNAVSHFITTYSIDFFHLDV